MTPTENTDGKSRDGVIVFKDGVGRKIEVPVVQEAKFGCLKGLMFILLGAGLIAVVVASNSLF